MSRFLGSLCLLTVAILSAEPPPADYHTLPIHHGVWRGQPVEFRLYQGWGLIDGDMLIELPAPSKDPGKSAVILEPERYRWPNATVAYSLDPALRNPARVTQAFQHWESRTLIRFKLRTDETAYVTIRSVDSGCSANVGMLGAQQFVNLADGCSLGNTIHELGHTIGLFHTQARLDRDRFLRVRFDNITRPEWSQYLQRLTDGFDSGPYDYGSIMHYPITGFTRNYGASMESFPAGIPMGQRAALSPEDIQAVNLLYLRPLENVIVTTTPPGLIVQVDGSACATPCEFPWSAGEQHTILTSDQQTLAATPNSRYDFVRWSDSAPIEHQITVDATSRVYNAHFARKVRIRTGVSPEQAGAIHIVPASADGWYPYGSTVSIRATPNENWTFYRMLPGDGGVTLQGANGLGLSANPSTILATNENLHYVATFTQQPVTTLATHPPGRRILLNGGAFLGPVNFLFPPGAAHELSVADPQPVTATIFRHDFAAWSDGGSFSHTITIPSDSSTITAAFRSSFQMSFSTSWNVSTSAPTRPGARNILLSPAPDPDGFIEAGAQLDVRASNEEGWAFTNWTADFGGNAPLALTVDDAYLFNANFTTSPFLNANLFVHDATQRSGPVAPGELLTIYAPHADNVLFDGEPARILERFDDRLRLVVPSSIAGKRSTIVTINDRSLSFSIVPATPGIYTNGTGAGEIFSDTPPLRGEPFTLTASGFEPAMLNRVIVGDLDADILAAESLGDGLTRVSIRIPAALQTGKQPVFLAAGGPYSPPGVFLTLQ
jgi:astacin